VQSLSEHYLVEEREHCNVLHLLSPDAMNRLTRERILALTGFIEELDQDAARRISKGNRALEALLVSGNQHCFSVGADLKEIASLTCSRGLGVRENGAETHGVDR